MILFLEVILDHLVDDWDWRNNVSRYVMIFHILRPLLSNRCHRLSRDPMYEESVVYIAMFSLFDSLRSNIILCTVPVLRSPRQDRIVRSLDLSAFEFQKSEIRETQTQKSKSKEEKFFITSSSAETKSPWHFSWCKRTAVKNINTINANEQIDARSHRPSNVWFVKKVR